MTADMVANPSSICGWNPDMYGVRDTEAGQAYYDSLMELYTSWGVDFIKCDDICNTNIYPANPYSARHEIEMLRKGDRTLWQADRFIPFSGTCTDRTRMAL